MVKFPDELLSFGGLLDTLACRCCKSVVDGILPIATIIQGIFIRTPLWLALNVAPIAYRGSSKAPHFQ